MEDERVAEIIKLIGEETTQRIQDILEEKANPTDELKKLMQRKK